MKIKSIVYFLCAIVMLSMGLSGCTRYSAEYEYYPSEESLVQASDIIVYGELVKEEKAKKLDINTNTDRTEKQKEEDMITYTVSELKVHKVIKGNLKAGEIIKVKQLGDKDGISQDTIKDNGGYYKKGSEYVMFLADFEKILPGTPYEALNPIQGQIEFVDGEAKVNKNNKLFKDELEKDKLIAKIAEIVKKQK